MSRLWKGGWRVVLALALALCPVVACDRTEPTPTAELDIDWVEGRDFSWRDTGHAKGDFERDVQDCRSRLSADPWFLAQPPLNRSILLIGCVGKHGWAWQGGNQGGTPVSDRRPGAPSRRSA